MAGLYVRRGERVAGPFSTDQLKVWVRDGKLAQTDELAKDLAGPWVQAGQTKLFGAGHADVPATPLVAQPRPTALVPVDQPNDDEPPTGPVFAIINATKASTSAVTGTLGKMFSATGRALSASAQRRHELKLAKLKAMAEIAAREREELAAARQEREQNAPALPPGFTPAGVPGQFIQHTTVNVVNKNSSSSSLGGCGCLLLLVLAFILYALFSAVGAVP